MKSAFLLLFLAANAASAANELPRSLDPDQTRPALPRSLDEATRTVETHVIRAALDETGGHRLRAAKRLGISERTLRYRLAEMRAVAA
jgi:two-component system response regulator FlrC